ncbi:hypothetical protein HYDPIDRAFT_43257 [Hydnomerulius pinastri MD-312]|uniref:Unplaced genomic scaffold scaffold_37, whole genome shotgun sequence n=1 Tax=Hydnomerulius pinastri MD-312 TaxID=994086 RepID=A0A0C9WB70_9AGAM|nr:hypothetical protein HYDPIDRAFT_43257 [Hydnomerulius pinastri MD-312]
MHHALSIVEVQRIIFRAALHLGSGGCQSTLATLARTCRAFTESALDILWEVLPSFLPLIQCLPKDLWKLESLAPWPVYLSFHRPMQAEDWEIFFKYSCRVRCINALYGPGDPECTEDVLSSLCLHPELRPLIPQLRKLTWSIRGNPHNTLLYRLLVPSITSLTICDTDFYADWLSPPEADVLSSIATSCPSLQVLRIRSAYKHADALNQKCSQTLSTAVLSLRFLHTLVCTALDEDTVIHLSRLPTLSKLSLTLPATVSLDKLRPHLRAPAFGRLRSLTVYHDAETLSVLTSFLEAMQLSLASVKLYLGEGPTIGDIEQVFAALTTACAPRSLTKVILGSRRSHVNGMSGPHAITLDTLQPLLAFERMENFTLDVPCLVGLDDAAIQALATHWPRLSNLILNPTYKWNPRHDATRVTPHGLAELATRCPKLCKLAISVDFASIDVEPPAEPLPSLCNTAKNTKLTYLNLLNTPRIAHPLSVANFLLDVFPGLDGLCPDDGDNDLLARERFQELRGWLVKERLKRQ